MSTEERKPVRFETIPTRNWFMSPVPRPRIVRLLRRLLRAKEVPEHLRCAPASPVPNLDTSTWPEMKTEIAGVQLRVPPGLEVREVALGDLDHAQPDERLVGLCEGEGRSLAVWTAAKPEYPIGVYNMRERPVREEWSESRERISGRDVAIAAFRVSLRGHASKYEVVAYWPLAPGRWMSAAAHAESREAQEQFLVALRTLRIPQAGPQGSASG